jgi:hypothetical protein
VIPGPSQSCGDFLWLSDNVPYTRCNPDDLERERGPVLEEWRGGRNAAGRAQQALWELMHRGSKFADRMPIGLESVIRNVSAETVKAFYTRWYHPQNMAVIIVGDYEVCRLDPSSDGSKLSIAWLNYGTLCSPRCAAPWLVLSSSPLRISISLI